DYLWSKGETTPTITIRQSGDYSCEMMRSDGCPAVTDTVNVIVNPLPAKPVITRSLDILSATDATAWQWYREGSELPGETGKDLQLQRTGSYQVRVENEFGCEAWSDPFDVTVLDVEDAALSVDRFDLYPNPSSGAVTVTFSLRTAAVPIVSVHDMLGRELLRESAATSQREGQLRLELSAFPAGLYHLRLLAGSTSLTRQLLLLGGVK
ncbi:MAG: T9SS type A sorting domain-containing protein, partial [Bacteroidota bacterium]